MEFKNFIPNTESVAIYSSMSFIIGCINIKNNIGVLFYVIVGTIVLPGKYVPGAQLKDGTRIKYKLNGLLVHFVAMLLYIMFSNLGFGYFDGRIVWRNFTGIAGFAMIFSLFFATFLYIKANIQKKNLNIHGNNNFLMNWFTGVELNPFIFGFEIKTNSYRPAFILEHLIAISAMYEQYYSYNEISISMIVFQFIVFSYIFDCYYYEDGLILMFDIIEEK